jgi:hypothetical protein
MRCAKRRRGIRSPPCWLEIPPPTSPWKSRTEWPSCLTRCGRRSPECGLLPYWPKIRPPPAVRRDWDAQAWLFGVLYKAEPGDQVAALLARDPATHFALDSLYAIPSLLDELQAPEAREQAAALAARAAAQSAVDDLCVPRTLSTSCDQAVFVDHATDASVSPDVVSLKIDRFG